MNPLKTKRLFLLLPIALFSCQDRTADHSVHTIADTKPAKLDVAGQVYFYAPELDKKTCEAYGECDCCSGNILFLDERTFLTIDICESDVSYYKGTYKIVDGNLLLSYAGVRVEKNYNWERETDTTGTVTTEYLIETSKTDPRTQTLTRIACEKNTCFKTNDTEAFFASPDKKQKIADLVRQIEEDGIWEKLEMK
ncbi:MULTISPECIES: hypothetical protein [unclassified Flavobacterium]|uniref:hypothetical protein n=1 Tax=unclassified Flavobacterium TaxID=196869 RepID=UPI001F131104|nr:MULTISPECIES: hypothetical protein [unclassified Flavobacterium]UMY64369.1 hypothetical protein MKO97_07565 [Flavobacterium sp. HJ-32-4]